MVLKIRLSRDGMDGSRGGEPASRRGGLRPHGARGDSIPRAMRRPAWAGFVGMGNGGGLSDEARPTREGPQNFMQSFCGLTCGDALDAVMISG